MELALEVSVFIHRFHNLDLFQQGWYAVKVSCCWEGLDRAPGIPSRVVQYEGVAGEAASDGLATMWRINDNDHSFCSRPFRIKYARQDVNLDVMVSFTLQLDSAEKIRTSSVIFKCELLFTPLDGFIYFNSMQLELPSVSDRLFRIPSTILHGVHSYCPVQFDPFHMALVDLFIHTVLLSFAHLPQTQWLGEESQDGEIQTEWPEENQLQDAETQAFLHASKESIQGQLAILGRPLVEAEKPLSYQLSSLWSLFLKVHRENKTTICKRLRRVWIQEQRNICSIWVVPFQEGYRTSLKIQGVGRFAEDPVYVSSTQAESYRRCIKVDGFKHLQDMQIFGSPLRQPVVLVEQENFRDEAFAGGVAKPKLNIVVFVHGFQGHHLDLRLVRNQWLLIDPGAEFLMSEANEGRTADEFGCMGQRLAGEVAEFLKIKLAEGRTRQRDCKLSFVGHSIGNLIIRAALMEPALQPYLKYLSTFLSISGPHLGYMYSTNSLFNSGLWLLKKVRGAACMHQLTFTDAANVEDCYLVKLSQAKTFQHFQHVVLVSSPQDRYVPYHSARVQRCSAAAREKYNKRVAAFTIMVHNCELQLRATSPAVERSLIRCDVNFHTHKTRSFNSVIGRTAHIEFLETDAYMRFIMWSFPGCFT